MTLAEFQDLVDRFGDRLADWPADQRHEAEALLAESEPARSMIDESRSMRGLFAAAPKPAGRGLSDRILRAAGLPRQGDEPVKPTPAGPLPCGSGGGT